MANVAESLITDMQTIKHLVRSNRRLAIRNKITECERILKQNMGGLEQIRSVMQDAKDRAFQEITRHSPNGIPTRTAEFYQEVFEELSARIPTFIQELEDGTFQINLPGPCGRGHPNYNEHEYFLAVETAFTQWEAMQNVGH